MGVLFTAPWGKMPMHSSPTGSRLIREAFESPPPSKEEKGRYSESSNTQASASQLPRRLPECDKSCKASRPQDLYSYIRREIFEAIKQEQKKAVKIPIRGNLMVQLDHWRFLDNSEGCIPWRTEKHETVDSYRAIFKENGREGDWDERLGLGNPAACQQGSRDRHRRLVHRRAGTPAHNKGVPMTKG
ncbi:hypothetical protein Bbelb_019050 [Branchiostoma belcheri]|nr:hypothetical protein Bbelb_019050 [Branchiostoma belcheri]